MKLAICLHDCTVKTLLWSEYHSAWVDPLPTCPDFPKDVDARSFSNRKTQCLAKEVSRSPNTVPIDVSFLRFMLPVLFSSKVICVGLNYADHAAEFGDPIPAEPIIFSKAPSALLAHQESIVLPKASQRIDYEAELVVVIGRDGRCIPKERAFEYVAGYTCGNDVSARDWQKGKPAGQWFLGKSFDTFAPLGPSIVTPDEIPNPNELAITSRLNGKVMQSSNTKNLIFPVEELISYISHVMTLREGDLIFTGTPGGVGERRNPPVYLQAGDTFEVEIEKIGTLTNTVIMERSSPHLGLW